MIQKRYTLNIFTCPNNIILQRKLILSSKYLILFQVILPLLIIATTYILILSKFLKMTYLDTKPLVIGSNTTTTEIKQKVRHPGPRRMSVIAMNQKKNHQETKLLIILVTVFLSCVLPYNVFFFHHLLQNEKTPPSNQIVLIFSTLMMLQMTNSFLHPLIYSIFYAPFKKVSMKILSFPIHCLRTWKGRNMQHHHINGSQHLCLNQRFVDGCGNSSRKVSRVSFGGRKYSTSANIERKYSRVSSNI